MNSFPLTPKQTVVFFPSNMNVNMSPYWKLDQHGFAVSDDAGIKYLLPTAKEEVVRVNSVGDGTANERNPVKHNWRFTGVFEKKLAEHVDNDGNNKERQEASSEDDGSGFVRQKITQRLRNDRKNTHGQKRETMVLHWQDNE